MSKKGGDNVVPLFRPKEEKASIESDVQKSPFSLQKASPFLDLPPGGRIEVGLGCIFISLKPDAGFVVRRNWRTWVTHLQERLKSTGSSYEVLREKGEFPNCIRIRTLPVDATTIKLPS